MRPKNTNCCTPSRSKSDALDIKSETGGKADLPETSTLLDDEHSDGMVRLEGGTFLMDITTVTNARFLAFMEDTNYTTEVENFGWSFVFC